METKMEKWVKLLPEVGDQILFEAREIDRLKAELDQRIAGHIALISANWSVREIERAKMERELPF
jgi:hypothetical protein